jgi:hypothetical protein
LAGIAADALSNTIAKHGRDRAAIALAMDEATTVELEPHYLAAVAQDADRIELHAAQHEGREPDAAPAAARDFILNGLLPASRTDPDVFRRFFRSFNMLDAPDALLSDPVVLHAASAAHATKDERPPAPELGPPRDELLAVMAAAAGA